MRGQRKKIVRNRTLTAIQMLKGFCFPLQVGVANWYTGEQPQLILSYCSAIFFFNFEGTRGKPRIINRTTLSIEWYKLCVLLKEMNKQEVGDIHVMEKCSVVWWLHSEKH